MHGCCLQRSVLVLKVTDLQKEEKNRIPITEGLRISVLPPSETFQNDCKNISRQNLVTKDRLSDENNTYVTM
jgi:hypothetical protein